MKNILHATTIGLPEKERLAVMELLNETVASKTDLYLRLKQAHWNVKGMEFIALHKLFDEIADELLEHIDIVAERVTSLGGTALGTLQAAAQKTILPPYPTDIFSGREHLEQLIDSFTRVSTTCRGKIKKAEDLGDIATGDVYISLTRMLDKNLWFLQAHLQK